MKEKFFRSVLLVACPQFSSGAFQTLFEYPVPTGDGVMTEYISVVCLNCRNKAEIIPYLQALLQEYKSVVTSNIAKHNILWLSTILASYETHEKDLTPAIKRALAHHTILPLTQENVLYLEHLPYMPGLI
jgi:hypothetical protein